MNNSTVVWANPLAVTKLDQLFSALLLTSGFAFIAGNLLLLNAATLWISAPISLHCIGLLCIFYMLSRQLNNLLWGLSLTYGLMVIVVYSHTQWSTFFVYALEIFSFIYALVFLRLPTNHKKILILMSAIGAATVLGVADAYTSFNMQWRLHSGAVYQDTLFHASLAAMIKNYGVASDGLNGLMPIQYHTLSHTLFACISSLSGAGVIDVYGVANWVLFAPLLVFSVSALCWMLDKDEQLSLPWIWCVVCLLLVVMPFLFTRWALWDSYFVSESYLVSLGIFVLGMSLLYQQRLVWQHLILLVVMAGLITNAKASVGLVFTGLWFARLLFVRSEQKVVDLVAFLLVAGVAVRVVMASASAVADAEIIEFTPFHFLTYSLWGSHIDAVIKAVMQQSDVPATSVALAVLGILSFFIAHFLLSWIAAAHMMIKNGWLAIVNVPAAIYIAASALAGAGILFVFAIPGGSAYYFSNVSFFVALPVAVLIVVQWLQGKVSEQKQLRGLSLLLIAILVISWPQYHKNSIFDKKHRRGHPDNTLINKLLAVRESDDKRSVLNYSLEKPLTNPVNLCTAQPLVFSAVSERPWTGVINLDEHCHYMYYGYAQLKLTEKNKVGVDPVIPDGMAVYDFK